MTEAHDTGYAPPRWTFDAEVARVFDDMLARSIPQLDVMRKAVFDVGRRYVQPGTHVVDLGCSRGSSMAPFVRTFGARAKYLCIDVSEPMLDACRERFDGWLDNRLMRVEAFDLRTGFPPVRASLVLGVLTLQFTPIEHRFRILRDVQKHLAPGGAFVLVEKVLGSTAELQEVLVDVYHAMKRDNGYTEEEVERKRVSLEGALVPVTARWNEEMLRGAGFEHVDCFWRWMNFAAWVAVKGE